MAVSHWINSWMAETPNQPWGNGHSHMVIEWSGSTPKNGIVRKYMAPNLSEIKDMSNASLNRVDYLEITTDNTNNCTCSTCFAKTRKTNSIYELIYPDLAANHNTHMNRAHRFERQHLFLHKEIRQVSLVPWIAEKHLSFDIAPEKSASSRGSKSWREDGWNISFLSIILSDGPWRVHGTGIFTYICHQKSTKGR